MSYVTALPSNPLEGQEIYYGADATNSAIWHLRYRGAKSGSYKWEYLGGAPMEDKRDGQYAPTNTGNWCGLATDGATPALTFPLAGFYDVMWGAEIVVPSGTYMYMGVNMSGSGTWSSVLIGSSASTSPLYATLCKEVRTTVAAAAGGSLACYYWTNSLTALAAYRYLRLRPVAVG